VLMAHIRGVVGSTPTTATNFFLISRLRSRVVPPIDYWARLCLEFFRPLVSAIALSYKRLHAREWDLGKLFDRLPALSNAGANLGRFQIQVGCEFRVWAMLTIGRLFSRHSQKSSDHRKIEVQKKSSVHQDVARFSILRVA